MRKRNPITTSQTAILLLILSVGSKPLGFIRELVLGNYFGASVITDAYVMASSIPNTLIAAVLGAIGTAFMPLLTECEVHDGESAGNSFTNKILNSVLLISACAIVLGIIFARPLTAFFAPGFDEEAKALTVFYLKIGFFSLLGSATVAIMEPYLQFRNRQLVTPILGYIKDFIIIALIILSAKFDYRLLILGVVISEIAKGVFAWGYAHGVGYRYEAKAEFGATIKEVLALAMPVFIGSSAGQINAFVDRMLASGLETGSVAALNYANIVVGTVSTLAAGLMMNIIYPKLNVAFAEKDFEKISSLSQRSIDLFSCLAVPLTVGGVVYAGPVIRVIFERGAFVGAGIELTTKAFLFYILGLTFMSAELLLSRVYYSMHDMKIPLYCSLVAIAVNIGLNFVLVGRMGVGGLALATSVARMSNTAMLCILLKKKHSEIRLLRSKRKLALICVFSTVAVGVSYLVYKLLAATGINELWTLLATVAIAGVVYLALMIVGKFEELNLIKDIFNRGK